MKLTPAGLCDVSIQAATAGEQGRGYGRDGRQIETDAWQCLRCTVMFREPMRFSKLHY
jgi:hypothetical protein